MITLRSDLECDIIGCNERTPAKVELVGVYFERGDGGLTHPLGGMVGVDKVMPMEAGWQIVPADFQDPDKNKWFWRIYCPKHKR